MRWRVELVYESEDWDASEEVLEYIENKLNEGEYTQKCRVLCADILKSRDKENTDG